MKLLTQQLIEQIIKKNSFINNYPKPGVAFLMLDGLFNDPISRKMVSAAVTSAVASQTFDAVASIASRGYLFSGMIANQTDLGEFFIQKVKAKGDARFIQNTAKTEYSDDALQVLKGSIQKGKKYLLTDDLIATGGSVMTAIQLIRECGGLVDTVYVLTEVVDLGAREKLKKIDVELISSLAFTTQDAQKLMLLQACYEANPAAPITYSLSRHTKNANTLIRTFNAHELNVHLASQSPIKVAATRRVFQGMFDALAINVIEHDAESGVNRQPFGYEETLRGATNRIESLVDSQHPNNTILVAIENGLRPGEDDETYYDFVRIIVKKGDMTFIHTEDHCKVPASIVHAAKDKNGNFVETWGEVEKRLGLVKFADDPHQEDMLGGVSRTDHLFKALCHAVGKLKEKLLENSHPEIEDQHLNIKRLAYTSKSNKYAKRGVFFPKPTDLLYRKPINLYNQGCPLTAWNIDPEVGKRNSFMIFATGDAFALLVKKVAVTQAIVNIHVGIKHETFSPIVLLHEALQLCRGATEQKAAEITVALPEQFHPVLHANDFNFLLMSLFKASGVYKLYYYDKNYTGTLDNKNIRAMIPLTLSERADGEHYQISSYDLLDYLHFPTTKHESLDARVMHFTRKSYLTRTLAKFDLQSSNLLDNLIGIDAPSEIQIPELPMKPHVILFCSANKPLAEKIAESLRAGNELVKLCQMQGKGETATIPDDADICGAVVTIVQSTRPNPDNIEASREYHINGASGYFFEALLIARQAQLRSPKKINLINPYQFSARSDRAEDNLKGKTGAYVQHNGMLLRAAGVNHVITAECHDNHTMSGSYTGKNIQGTAIPALSIMSTRIANDWLNDPIHPLKGQIRLVKPDAGAAKRTKELAAELQAVLGKDRVCDSSILGEKERATHKDDSAVINSLNSGALGINADDKYLITDDETATGGTLCQAIANLKNNGAKNITVIVVHNNLPLDWLVRQICLARFLEQGVNELHFSDTQEMGTLAKSYEDLIQTYAQRCSMTSLQVEKQAFAWIKENFGKNLSDEQADKEFTRLKPMFAHLQSRVKVHSLAVEFANQVRTRIDMQETLENGEEEGVYAGDKGALLFLDRNDVIETEKRDIPHGIRRGV